MQFNLQVQTWNRQNVPACFITLGLSNTEMVLQRATDERNGFSCHCDCFLGYLTTLLQP